MRHCTNFEAPPNSKALPNSEVSPNSKVLPNSEPSPDSEVRQSTNLIVRYQQLSGTVKHQLVDSSERKKGEIFWLMQKRAMTMTPTTRQ